MFRAFGVLYEIGNQAETLCDTEEVIALAGAKDGKKALLITNVSGKEEKVCTNLEAGFKAYLIDEDNMTSPVDVDVSSFILKENQVILLKKEKSNV